MTVCSTIPQPPIPLLLTGHHHAKSPVTFREIRIKRRSGRKLVTLPNGETAKPRPWDIAATPLQLALARGHRWLALLESGEAKTLKEIAVREGIDNSYVSRMVNLTTLAPDIVAAILDDALPNHLTLFDLAVDPPALWAEQRARIANSTPVTD